MSASLSGSLAGPASALAPAPGLGPAEAHRIVAIAREHAGLALRPERADFLRSRLSRRLRETGAGDFPSYLARLEGPRGAAERARMVEALTTHTTAFFRERRHFDWLESEGLAALAARGAGRRRPLLAWSAACSTGAEMWSAAMTLDAFRDPHGAGLDWSVAGSDVSRRILRRAAGATFDAEEIEGVPEPFRKRYLMRGRRPRRPARYRIAPELRARARLLFANLMDLDAAPDFRADVVFLRNVLIYFDPPDRRRIVGAVARRLSPGGFLIVGHAETLEEAVPGLAAVATSVYRREDRA
ncbi:MAG: CheR family methyltransferase [Paracoccaceae bacterium]